MVKVFLKLAAEKLAQKGIEYLPKSPRKSTKNN